MDEYSTRILELLKKHPRGLINEEVAKEIGSTHITVGKKLDVLYALKLIEREHVGSAIKNYYKKNAD